MVRCRPAVKPSIGRTVHPAPRIAFSREALADFCRRNRIRRLAFFGSVLRDDFGPESDVDVLYEFEEGAVVGWDIVGIRAGLSAILGDRRVDMVPFRYISPRLRDRVLAEAADQYVAA